MEILPHQRLLPGMFSFFPMPRILIYSSFLSHLHVPLPTAFVDLVQSQDADIMKLGLQYIDLLLTRVPRASKDDDVCCLYLD